jgi:hypothetical protein
MTTGAVAARQSVVLVATGRSGAHCGCLELSDVRVGGEIEGEPVRGTGQTLIVNVDVKPQEQGVVVTEGLGHRGQVEVDVEPVTA